MTQTVTIIDYGSGNLKSAAKAFERAARGTETDIVVTADADAVRRADRIVLPGVGAFADCKAGLEAVPGMVEVLNERVIRGGAPFLGICVGMQLLYDVSEESPGVAGLGVLPGTLRLLPASVKRPQMQWNVLDVRRPSALFATVEDPVWVYFVHSYGADPDGEGVVATCDYGGPVAAAVERGPLWATQFHSEKSGGTGLQILEAFVAAAARWAGLVTSGEELR